MTRRHRRIDLGPRLSEPQAVGDVALHWPSSQKPEALGIAEYLEQPPLALFAEQGRTWMRRDAFLAIVVGHEDQSCPE